MVHSASCYNLVTLLNYFLSWNRQCQFLAALWCHCYCPCYYSFNNVWSLMWWYSAISVELYYIFATLWGREQYTLYGILFVVYAILLSVTACISVALTYFQLSVEDYRWWWRSIFSAGLVFWRALWFLLLLLFVVPQQSSVSFSLWQCGYVGSGMDTSRLYQQTQTWLIWSEGQLPPGAQSTSWIWVSSWNGFPVMTTSGNILSLDVLNW